MPFEAYSFHAVLRSLFKPRFRYLEPNLLRDNELELAEPSRELVGDFLQSVRHPQCTGEPECQVTPAGLDSFLRNAPRGHERPDERQGRPPAYRFWMRLHPRLAHVDGQTIPLAPPLPIGGTISLRISQTEATRVYYGHIGYVVFPPARGHHYSERACRLVLPLARQHGMRELWITTNPDNIASRRTCERLGCELIETIDVPVGHPLWHRGERRKCRYLLRL